MQERTVVKSGRARGGLAVLVLGALGVVFW
jgi:hypothetical protein